MSTLEVDFSRAGGGAKEESEVAERGRGEEG